MSAKLQQLLSRYVPESAVDYCLVLWKKHPFHFKVTKKRNSKAGDYRFNPKNNSHTITVNHDLNVYGFLITYIHEVAHLHNYIQYKRQVQPHGKEWQQQFKTLMLPVLNNQVFPDDILRPLALHLKKPKASTYTDHRLVTALRKYDENDTGISLSDIGVGEVFSLNKRVFKKEALRRTRVICLEINTGRKYLIPGIALVEKLSEGYSSLD